MMKFSIGFFLALSLFMAMPNIAISSEREDKVFLAIAFIVENGNKFSLRFTLRNNTSKAIHTFPLMVNGNVVTIVDSMGEKYDFFIYKRMRQITVESNHEKIWELSEDDILRMLISRKIKTTGEYHIQWRNGKILKSSEVTLIFRSGLKEEKNRGR